MRLRDNECVTWADGKGIEDRHDLILFPDEMGANSALDDIAEKALGRIFGHGATPSKRNEEYCESALARAVSA